MVGSKCRWRFRGWGIKNFLWEYLWWGKLF
jgi:hypothetical protein